MSFYRDDLVEIEDGELRVLGLDRYAPLCVQYFEDELDFLMRHELSKQDPSELEYVAQRDIIRYGHEDLVVDTLRGIGYDLHTVANFYLRRFGSNPNVIVVPKVKFDLEFDYLRNIVDVDGDITIKIYEKSMENNIMIK